MSGITSSFMWYSLVIGGHPRFIEGGFPDTLQVFPDVAGAGLRLRGARVEGRQVRSATSRLGREGLLAPAKALHIR